MTVEKVGGAKAQSTAFLAVKSHFSLQMILLTCTPPDPLVGSISQISVPQSDHPNCHPRVAATLRNVYRPTLKQGPPHPITTLKFRKKNPTVRVQSTRLTGHYHLPPLIKTYN